MCHDTKTICSLGPLNQLVKHNASKTKPRGIFSSDYTTLCHGYSVP